MRDKKEFFSILSDIDGQPYDMYAKLIGDFDFSRYVLKINQVQDREGHPYTLLVLRVPQIIAGFPPHTFNSPVRRTALEDVLTRHIAAEIESLARYDHQGISRRRLFVSAPGQKILPRTSLVITEEYVEARVAVNLPAEGGGVFGDAAKDIFFYDVPAIVNGALIYCNLEETEVEGCVDIMEDADQVRQVLTTRGLVAFLAEGSLVGRAGNTDLPEQGETAPLMVPEDLRVEVDTPNTGPVRGLGIPQGVTLILGDDYSGRIELMRAIAHGIYNHIPGDGRELVLTVPDAVYVAAEPGRSIQRVDVSPFLKEWPTDGDPETFSSADADAFSSQAAATVESLEVGARVLLFDESDSSPAFLARDSRLQSLLGDDPKTMPLSERARQIVDELGVSIVVAGSSAMAELIPVADTILRIDGMMVEDVTDSAREMSLPPVEPAGSRADITALVEKNRWLVPTSIDASEGKEDCVVHAESIRSLLFGRSTIDLSAIRQLADLYQTETIGRILYYAKLHYLDEGRPMREVLDLVDRDLSTEGLECLSPELRGDLARPRRYELAAALNRLATLRISHTAE